MERVFSIDLGRMHFQWLGICSYVQKKIFHLIRSEPIAGKLLEKSLETKNHKKLYIYIP